MGLSGQGIADVGEPSSRVIGGDRADRHVHRLHQRLAGAGAESAQEGLDLRERLLDRRAVGRGGRQEEELAVARRAGLANTGGLVDAQIVEHDPCPGRSVGPNSSMMYHAKVAVSIAPANIPGTRRPSGVNAATKVVFLPWLRGTDPVARRSCGAQPERRVSAVCVPLTSTKTKSAGCRRAMASRHAARAYSRESGYTEDEALTRIVDMFEAENNRPTDIGSTMPRSQQGH